MTQAVGQDLLTAESDIDRRQYTSRRSVHIFSHIPSASPLIATPDEEFTQVLHGENTAAGRQERSDIHGDIGFEEGLHILSIDALLGDGRGFQGDDSPIRIAKDVFRQTRVGARRGDNLHPLGKVSRQQREDRLGIRPVWILEVGVLVDSIDEEDQWPGNGCGTARRRRSTQQLAELGALSRITHGFGVLVSKNLRELRAHNEGETPSVIPLVTDATDEEGHHVHVVGWVQREGRHDGGLAADHVRLHGVPDIVRPAHKRFEIGQLLLTIYQSIRDEMTEHLDVIINDDAGLLNPRAIE